MTLTTDNDMRVKASDRCRVIRVRSEIVISQLLLVCNFIPYALRLLHYQYKLCQDWSSDSSAVRNCYITALSFYSFCYFILYALRLPY